MTLRDISEQPSTSQKYGLPPIYYPDPKLKNLHVISNFTAHRKTFPAHIPPVESPVLRPPHIPRHSSYCSPRRFGLLCVLAASVTAGVSLAYAGAQAVDDLELYLNEIRYNRELDPYR